MQPEDRDRRTIRGPNRYAPIPRSSMSSVEIMENKKSKARLIMLSPERTGSLNENRPGGPNLLRAQNLSDRGTKGKIPNFSENIRNEPRFKGKSSGMGYVKGALSYHPVPISQGYSGRGKPRIIHNHQESGHGTSYRNNRDHKDDVFGRHRFSTHQNLGSGFVRNPYQDLQMRNDIVEQYQDWGMVDSRNFALNPTDVEIPRSNYERGVPFTPHFSEIDRYPGDVRNNLNGSSPQSPLRSPQSPLRSPQSPLRSPQSPLRSPQSPLRSQNLHQSDILNVEFHPRDMEDRDDSNHDQQLVECCICYDEVQPRNKLDCGHVVCGECISNIRNTECPVCRENIRGPSITPQVRRSIERRLAEDKSSRDHIDFLIAAHMAENPYMTQEETYDIVTRFL